MSKLIQIERALKAIDPAGFHRLCDSYLYALGHRNINSLGLVAGAEKEKIPARLMHRSVRRSENDHCHRSNLWTSRSGIRGVPRRSILSDRCKLESPVGIVLSHAFEGSSELGKRVIELLSTDVDLFANAYVGACEAAPGTDYTGAVFNALLDVDPHFPGRWVRSLLDKRRHDEDGDYSFIWKRSDHLNIVTRVLDELLSHSESRFDIYDVAEMLFRTQLHGEEKRILNERQDTFLDNIIENRNTDHELMSLLFWTISGFMPDRRRARIATFLRHNKDFDAFSRLAIEPPSYSLNIQAFRNRVVFLKSLLPLMNCLELCNISSELSDEFERSKFRLSSKERKTLWSTDLRVTPSSKHTRNACQQREQYEGEEDSGRASSDGRSQGDRPNERQKLRHAKRYQQRPPRPTLAPSIRTERHRERQQPKGERPGRSGCATPSECLDRLVPTLFSNLIERVLSCE
jgi:hypothetical protein